MRIRGCSIQCNDIQRYSGYAKIEPSPAIFSSVSMAILRCCKLWFAPAVFLSVALCLFLPPFIAEDAPNGGGVSNFLIKSLRNTRYHLIEKTVAYIDNFLQLLPVQNDIQAFLRGHLYHVFSHQNDIYKNKIHLVVVACGNRLEESLVNIKSSLLFTKAKVVFHIFAENALQDGFRDGIGSWPGHFRRNLEYRIYPITFPADGNQANWKKLFKPCASQRLFLPLILDRNIDSILYVDTDILFLSDVNEFWQHFHYFNLTQLSSLCIEHEDQRMGWYNRFARHPYYGKTGLNSGVMLMNLTRMRGIKYKNDLAETAMEWGEMLLPLYKKYKYNITWGDQDLLNIVFHHNPDMLHVFQCDWNYRPDHCMYGQLCKPASTDGVRIIHGSRQVYHNDKQPAFKAVYNAIQAYGFQSNLTKYLYEPMQAGLLNTTSTYCGKESGCILKGLRKAIEKKSMEP